VPAPLLARHGETRTIGAGVLRVGGIMSRFHSLLPLAGAVVLPLALGGCAGVLLVGGLGAAAGGGYVAAQERGVNGTIDDITVKTEIAQAFLKTNPLLQEGITTTVYDGRVLLSGRVPRPEMKTEANRVASAVPGVRALYEEVEVAPYEGVWDGAQDTWITARVRSELVLDPDIRSGNYTIDTENGSVYLIGSARSQYELDRAARIARYVPGVKRVVSYVEIRSGAPVAARPTSPPLSANPGTDRPGTGPAASIEVQRL
jgi:osmotically-inducible protein OsmY